MDDGLYDELVEALRHRKAWSLELRNVLPFPLHAHDNRMSIHELHISCISTGVRHGQRHVSVVPCHVGISASTDSVSLLSLVVDPLARPNGIKLMPGVAEMLTTNSDRKEGICNVQHTAREGGGDIPCTRVIMQSVQKPQAFLVLTP